MKSNLNVKIIAFLSIFYFLFFCLLQAPESFDTLVSSISKAVSAIAITHFIFTKWLWKFSWLQWLRHVHKVPLLEGNWSGHYDSTGNSATPNNRLRGAMDVEIVQPSLFSIKIIRVSKESRSRSFAEDFIQGDDGVDQLVYSYKSEPNAKVRDRSPISYGSARITLNSEKPDKLEGVYWSDVKTTGDFTLTKKK